MNNTTARIGIAATALLAAACASQPELIPEAQFPSAPAADDQLEFALASGNYHCDQGVRVGVQREHDDGRRNNRVSVLWDGRIHVLQRDPSHSGLPRFEDLGSGLVWIDLPWKGVLLDGRSHKPLATECRHS